jgi:hypothetical protein
MNLRLLIAGVMLTTSPALAAGTAEELMRDCQGRNSDSGFAYCIGYIAGIKDANALSWGIHKRGLFCLPERGLSNEQSLALFLAYMQTHPQAWHEPARQTVVFAHHEAFPCK